jgi:hypothetical protein
VFDSAGEVKVGPPIAGSFLLMGKMRLSREWFTDFSFFFFNGAYANEKDYCLLI